MRQQIRILLYLLALCMVFFLIINWFTTWTYPKRLLYKKLSSKLRSQIPNYHKITYGENSSSINHEDEDVLQKEEAEIILAEVKRPDFQPIRTDHGQSKASQIKDFISVILKLTRMNDKNKVVLMLRKALENLPRVPDLSSANVEDRTLKTVVPPAAIVTYDVKWHGLNLPVLTCSPLGRLGNTMGEYATMYALRNLYNASVVVNDVMKDRLRDFHHLSLPNLPGHYDKSDWIGVRNSGGMYNYASIELAASGLLGPHKFVMHAYAFEIQLFQKFREDLKREFAFSNYINRKVREFFDGIRKRRRSFGPAELVFVGFHIRRTDYVRYAHNMFGASLPGESYFNRSLEYYRAKFPPERLAFVAASDDPTFLKETLGKHPDVNILPDKDSSPAFDMAALSFCNHSIVTLGSYGFWTGFLAGGEVVYPDVKFKKTYRFSRPMYEKAGLHSFTPLPVD
ncbi:galactoside alpha-(1,2)-fucosyltransferase 2-like isoform X1 [Palaemon carinicauda]|uniref:galactoside alpha-(1,2)-fucosyltransferase 2-like isoform X1 n=1 Tax=Palaemon carinicauda TaxID=392227 RepID=UPI0035B6029C